MGNLKEKYKNKIKELLRYILVGVITTIINWGVAALLENFTNISAFLNTCIAWFVSVVLFAFMAYKLFVFKSKSMKWDVLKKEIPEFFIARLFTWGFEALFMAIFVDWLKFDNVLYFSLTRHVGTQDTPIFDIPIKEFYIFKFFATVIITILNYIASKYIVFKPKEIKDSPENIIQQQEELIQKSEEVISDIQPMENNEKESEIQNEENINQI